MRTGRLPRGDGGLTLLETLLASTILAVAGALVAGAFSAALRSWEAGRDRGREELVARVALERIGSQLRSAVASCVERGREPAIAFDAGEETLRFVTPAVESGAPVQVSYGLARDGGAAALLYREHAWPDKRFFEDPPAHREEVVPEITSFRVSVTRREQEGDAGRPPPGGKEWEPTDGVLPGKVAIEIGTAAAGGSGRYGLTVGLAAGRDCREDAGRR